MKNRILRLTATQAARDFSRLLDRVENGAEAIIERHSRPVAVIRPPDIVPRRISECMAIKLDRPSVAPDPDFAKDLKEIIEGHRTEEPPSWDKCCPIPAESRPRSDPRRW